MKFCIACGMPMRTKAILPWVTKPGVCKYVRADRSMKSYDEALLGMTGFIVKTQGLTKAQAESGEGDDGKTACLDG